MEISSRGLKKWILYGKCSSWDECCDITGWVTCIPKVFDEDDRHPPCLCGVGGGGEVLLLHLRLQITTLGASASGFWKMPFVKAWLRLISHSIDKSEWRFAFQISIRLDENAGIVSLNFSLWAAICKQKKKKRKKMFLSPKCKQGFSQFLSFLTLICHFVKQSYETKSKISILWISRVSYKN